MADTNPKIRQKSDTLQHLWNGWVLNTLTVVKITMWTKFYIFYGKNWSLYVGGLQQAVGIPDVKTTRHHPDSSKCIGFELTTSLASSHRTINRSVLAASRLLL